MDNSILYQIIPYLVILSGYALLLTTSGKVISRILKSALHKSLEQVADTDNVDEVEKKQRLSIGEVIGKCENIIILTFLLIDAVTAIAIVVTAKTIVRKEEIEKNSMFFLGGTLINVAYSVSVGFIVKLILLKVNFAMSISK